MKYKVTKILLSVLIVSFISSTSLAFNPDTDCSGVTVEVSNKTDIIEALGNVNESNLKDGQYIICFENIFQMSGYSGESPIKIGGEPLQITGKDKPFIIHGLFLMPEYVLTPYTGIIVSISNSTEEIILNDLKVVSNPKADSLPSQALALTGSNVIIENSEIHAKDIGIEANNISDLIIKGTSIKNAKNSIVLNNSSDITTEDSNIIAKEIGILFSNTSNVTIKNTTISGEDSPDSKAVYIDNTPPDIDRLVMTRPTKADLLKKVLIAQNDVFEKFDYGIYIKNGGGISLNSIFTDIDPNKAIYRESPDTSVVDNSGIGKIVDETGKNVSRIIGKSPAKSCSDIAMKNGYIDLYVNKQLTDETSESVIPDSSCTIKLLIENERTCIGEDESSICYDEGDCIFDCEELDIEPVNNVLFTYNDMLGNTHPFSEPVLLADLKLSKPWSTGSFPSSMPAPTSGGMTDTGPVDSTGTADYVDNTGPSGGEGATASPGGASGGCGGGGGGAMSIAAIPATGNISMIFVMLGLTGIPLLIIRKFKK